MDFHGWLRAIYSPECTLSAQERLVLTCLLRHCDQSGSCYPSFTRISEETALSRRTTIRAVRSLVDSGVISASTAKNGRSNVYTLAGQVVPHRHQCHTDTSATQTLQGCHPDTTVVPHRHHGSATLALVPHSHQGSATQTPPSATQTLPSATQTLPWCQSGTLTIPVTTQGTTQRTIANSRHTDGATYGIDGEIDRAVNRLGEVDTRPSLLFAHYQAMIDEHNRRGVGQRIPRPRFLNDQAEAAILARLKEGYELDELRKAVDGCLSNPYNLGDNPHGQRYLSLELICRDGSKVEHYIASADRDPEVSQAKSSRKSRTEAIIEVQQRLERRIADEQQDQDHDAD
jgi:DNA-binding Lrp family transcriptional regulator